MPVSSTRPDLRSRRGQGGGWSWEPLVACGLEGGSSRYAWEKDVRGRHAHGCGCPLCFPGPQRKAAPVHTRRVRGISEGMTESFAQLFEQSLANQRIRPGMILTGLIVEVTSDVVIVNVGLKSEAVIPLEQFKNERGEVEVKAGDQVEVALDSVEDGTGETRLSREKAKRARTWTRLEEAFNKSEIVTGVITGRVKGGFTVEIENVRAFLPGSLVDVRPVRDTSYLEGKPLEFKVIKLDQKRNQVVF